MSEQLTLIEGVRIERPASYDEVIETMLTGIGNNPLIGTWDPEKLADDMLEGAFFSDPNLTVEEIEKCIRIWRECNKEAIK